MDDYLVSLIIHVATMDIWTQSLRGQEISGWPGRFRLIDPGLHTGSVFVRSLRGICGWADHDKWSEWVGGLAWVGWHGIHHDTLPLLGHVCGGVGRTHLP